VGKSALAVHVAHQLAFPLPEAQLLVRMGGTTDHPLTAGDAQRRVLQTLDPTARLPDDEDALAASYRSALAGRRILLLFDDAANSAQVALARPAAPVRLLITSGGPIIARAYERGPGRAAAAGGARAAAQDRGRRRATNAELDALAERCCRLPLALRVAGDS